MNTLFSSFVARSFISIEVDQVSVSTLQIERRVVVAVSLSSPPAAPPLMDSLCFRVALAIEGGSGVVINSVASQLILWETSVNISDIIWAGSLKL